MVNNQVNAYKDIKGVDDNGKSITKEKSCTQKDQQATVKVADVTKHENSKQKEQPKTKPTKLTGIIEFTNPDDNSSYSPKVTMITEEK